MLSQPRVQFEYNDLALFIGSKLAETDGYNVSERVEQKIEQYKQGGVELTQEGALEEIVADSMFKVFENERYVQELFDQHETLGEKIKSKLKSFVKELKQLAKNLKSPEARAMAKQEAETVDKMAELFNNAATVAMAKRYNKVMQEAQAQQEQEGAQYQLKDSDGNIVELTEQQLEDNKKTVANMDTVATVTGNLFATGVNSDLVNDIDAYFAKIGRTAHNKVLGDVQLSKSGAKHLVVQKATKRRRALIEAIKPVIEKGELVHIDNEHKGHNFDTAIIAAPVKWKAAEGENAAKYYVGVVAKQSGASNDNTYYFHDAVLVDEKGGAVAASPNEANKSNLLTATTPSVVSVLRLITKYNGENGQNAFSIKEDAEFSVNTEARQKLEKRLYELGKTIGNGSFARSSLLRMFDADKESTRSRKELAQRLAMTGAAKAAYLADKRDNIKVQYKPKEYGTWGNEKLTRFIEDVGANVLQGMQTDAAIEAQAEMLQEAIGTEFDERYANSRTPAGILARRRAAEVGTYAEKVRNAQQFLSEQGTDAAKVIDTRAMEAELNEKAPDADVARWMEKQLKGVIGGRTVGSSESDYEGMTDRKATVDKETRTAQRKYGTTTDWQATGYLTVDGKQLDFSAGQGTRTMDHRDVLDVYENGEEMSGTDAMIDFMSRGNIRIMPESNGINLQVPPTAEQWKALRRYINSVDGEVIVDMDNSNGSTAWSIEYTRGTSSQKVLRDIDAYFEDGVIPQADDINRYRYSLKEYSDHELENWKDSKDIEVYTDRVQGMNFINRALTDNSFRKKLYFGKVDERLAAAIKEATGLGVEDYNLALHADEVRKIAESHGNEESENQRGQSAITVEDLLNIPETVKNATKIRAEEYNGNDAIVFVREQGNRTTTVTYVVNKKHDLRVQTMYKSNKKRGLSTAFSVQAENLTSETDPRYSPSDANVAQGDKNVKNMFSLKEDTGVLASLQGVDKINENMRQQIEDSEDFRQVLRKKAKNHYRSAGLQCLIAGNFEEWSIFVLSIVVRI